MQLLFAFHRRFGCYVCHLFKGFDERRPAVRVAGVVDRVDADEDIPGADNFRIAQRQGEKHGVACRYVGDRYARFLLIGNGEVEIGQRRSAELAKADG
nr:hypothetical protein [Alkalilimnicola ehrlichii]